MIGTIVRKEIASNLLSYKFFVVILLTTVLIFTSLFVMARDYKARQADYELIKPEAGRADRRPPAQSPVDSSPRAWTNR